MELQVLIVSILAVATILPTLLINRVFRPSDNRVQLSIVELIRENNHRFIEKNDSFLFCSTMVYPQFLFWVLSFFSPKNYTKATLYLFIVFHFLSALAFVVFVMQVHPFIAAQVDISIEKLMLYSGAIYLLTPFSYNINNAKNTGISTRGLGLFAGQVYLYLTVLYRFTNDPICLCLSVVPLFLILISSVFGLQLIVFVVPLLMLLYTDLVIGLPLLVAFVIFFTALPDYGSRYIIGQFKFKVFYFQYLAKNILLSRRYSIWRDFVWDFWKILLNKMKIEGSLKKGVMYIYDNPMVILLFSIPFCVPLFIYLALEIATVGDDGFSQSYQIFVFLFIPVVATVTVFLLTSFRLTRFLGEPERYVEFTLGFIAICSVLAFAKHEIIIHFILGFSLLLNIVQFVAMRARLKEKTQAGFFDDLKKIESYFDDEVVGEIRILSNNNQICKLLISNTRKVFFGWPYSARIGSFHFSDIYKEGQYLKANKIIPIAKEFQINYFVLDKGDIPSSDPLITEDGFLKLITDHSELGLYKIENTHA